MRIDTAANYIIYPSQRTHALSAPQTKNDKPEKPDFTNMTRQEMRDWINSQLRSGKMTFEESSPFVAMTIKISAIDGREVTSENDFSRQNFIEKAKEGLQASLKINDVLTSKKLASALSTMLNINYGQ